MPNDKMSDIIADWKRCIKAAMKDDHNFMIAAEEATIVLKEIDRLKADLRAQLDGCKQVHKDDEARIATLEKENEELKKKYKEI